MARKQVVIVTISSNMLVVIAGPTDVFCIANKILESRGITDGYEVVVAAATPDKRIDTGTG